MTNSISTKMYELAKKLFPICRSITGQGVRDTLEILKQEIDSDLIIHEVQTGTKCFDWEIPKEWNIRDAYIITPQGEKIADFKKNNLHVWGYSCPINKTLSLNELQEHLHSLPQQPHAIPYCTTYYKKDWGFCISNETREKLSQGEYKVFIDSSLENGVLNYAELILPGETSEEIFLSTYICHPSMANNEISGPVVTTFLIKWLKNLINRKYTYRIVFIPETIGSILYISKNLNSLKKNVVAGYNITCIGDNRTYSFLPSRNGKTQSDQVAKHVLKNIYPNFVSYDFLERGSDERQYCSPGVDLPIATIMRSKYATYPEYHTSEDNLSLISPEGLLGGYDAIRLCLNCLEQNNVYKLTTLCEPQLGKYGLYPTRSTTTKQDSARNIINFLAYCDGVLSLLEIAEIINIPLWEAHDMAKILEEKGVIVKV